jgi:hypothetical protein
MIPNNLVTNATDLFTVLRYLNANYNTITDAEYISLVKDSFGVYEGVKPQTLEIALKRIQMFFNAGFCNIPLRDRPLFFGIIS